MRIIPAKTINEQLLIKHNIATAVSIIAATKGINPKDEDYGNKLDRIIIDAEKAYAYSFWRIQRHHTTLTEDVIQAPGSNAPPQ